jgi:hypothetical protein
MHVFHHPHHKPVSREAMADRLVWALIAAVVAVNVLLMWRIATAAV